MKFKGFINRLIEVSGLLGILFLLFCAFIVVAIGFVCIPYLIVVCVIFEAGYYIVTGECHGTNKTSP